MPVFLVLMAACAKETPQTRFVARVDQDVLTEEDLAGIQDSLTHRPNQRNEYINEWVNTELLYQEAKRRGFAESDQIRRELEDTKKKLAIAALLQSEIYRDENVSDDEIVALYNSGGEAFRLREDVVNASYALFSDRDAANVFRGKLVRGTTWTVAVDQTRKDTVLGTRLLQVATRQFFTQSTLYPPELWKLARNLGKDEVSFVAKIGEGYCVLVPHSVKKQGELPDLNYIRNEIHDRILIERRRTEYEHYLAGIRAKHSVEIRPSEGDTASRIPE